MPETRPEFILFEAEIIKVDYDLGTCSVRGVANNAPPFHDVPLPNFSGKFDHGLFIRWDEHTRVLCMLSQKIIGQNTSRSQVIILSVFPSKTTYTLGGADTSGNMNVPHNLIGLPVMGDASNSPAVLLNGPLGSYLSLTNNGDILLSSPDNLGYFCYSRPAWDTTISSGGIMISKSNSHHLIAGTAIRYFAGDRPRYIRKTFAEDSLRLDHSQDIQEGASHIGMFHMAPPYDLQSNPDGLTRNPRRAEYCLKINEYCEQSNFSGFERESQIHANSLKWNNTEQTLPRDGVPGNVLRMAENELIEIIAGNLIDINGDVLDLNYNSVVLGNAGEHEDGNPKMLYSVDAKLRSRREIGYHFQLSTNSTAKESGKGNNLSNFIVDIDKEGVIKMNFPRSSETGNIPFVSRANFVGSGDKIELEYANPSRKIPQPIHLYSDPIYKKNEDEFGESEIKAAVSFGAQKKAVVYPKTDERVRHTGVMYSNAEASKYFPDKTGANTVRVNTTRYHNMYAVAERLIACTVQGLGLWSLRPLSVADAKGFQFECEDKRVWDREKNSGDGGWRDDTIKDPMVMSVAYVAPHPPAINPGGAISVAGTPKNKYSLYSNAFKAKMEGDDATYERATAGDRKTASTAGKSANINFEGSVDLSIGKDVHDGKSLVLDTAGAMVAWFGKDKNDRSVIVQTDGAVLLSIGGSYGDGSLELNEDEDNHSDFSTEFNEGRLDIRVNVTDHGFVGALPPTKEQEEDPGRSDYLISISKEGMVIAGCANGKPMIIRNDGPVNIESSDMLTLKGSSISFVQGSIVSKPPLDRV